MRIHADSLEGRKAQALLDGFDVSDLCVEADDQQGWVELIEKDEKGQIRVGFDGEPLVKQHFGDVVINLEAA